MNRVATQREAIDFPNLQIHIEIVRRRGQPIALSLQTPSPTVPQAFDVADWPQCRWSGLSAEESSVERHAICNRLHAAAMSLDILERHTAEGDLEDVDAILNIAVESLTELERLA
ncbi:hypothetical protein [Rubripirellula reticaptiva]|uniref:Uncharacterized protein n=1 Tax=Rubripirellula reticaptiva TaxID=2528013 RepID=A0A5C6EG18_9BACT|nr:hypothetical protein [Rubripirellula reticaptiva]TWU46526.1 hypothetical protein Poly59_54990 [Rubripirellula reticaptiva]